MAQWHKFTGRYTKRFYQVKLPSGEIVSNCWPNAGVIHVNGVRYTPDDDIQIRPQRDYYPGRDE